MSALTGIERQSLPITLTADERETCAKFEVLLKRLVVGPVTSVTVSYISRGNGTGFLSSSAQDKHEAFFAPHEIADMAGRLANCITQVHAANPSEEVRRAKRIAELKADLERLEGQQVAA